MANPNMAATPCSVEGCNRHPEKRGMCGMHYQRVWKYGDPDADHRPKQNSGCCAVHGCTNTPRSRTALHCEAHYMRLRRNGTTAKVLCRKPVLEHSGGYLRDWSPSHPLANSDGYVYQHRAVLYGVMGDGPFVCHVCDVSLDWSTMHVDHLDDDPKNNDAANLAPACPRCNKARGLHKMATKLRARGIQLTVGGVTRCISEWARIVGIKPASLAMRLRSGWTVERAVTEPRGKTGPQAKR